MRSDLERDLKEVFSSPMFLITGKVLAVVESIGQIILAPYHAYELVSYAGAGRKKGGFQSNLLQIE